VGSIREAAQQLKLDPDKVVAEVPVAPSSSPAPVPSPPSGPAEPSAMPQPSQEDVARAAAMSPEQQAAMIRGMVEKLQARMDADGSDVEGWVRLAQARTVLGEIDRAKATWEHALSLHPDAPALLKGYAGSLLGAARADTGLPEIGDQAAALYTKAADLQPDDPEPWWYLGIRALQQGRKDEARASWQKVLAHLDPANPDYAAVKSKLDGLGS
jgi:cytochrome c-type biogenesis protein CcmH